MPLFAIFVYAIIYIENKYALSPGIEPRHTAPEADALSIEPGELLQRIKTYIPETLITCKDYLFQVSYISKLVIINMKLAIICFQIEVLLGCI